MTPEQRRRYRQARLLTGICTSCGQPVEPAREGKCRCEACQRKSNIRR